LFIDTIKKLVVKTIFTFLDNDKLTVIVFSSSGVKSGISLMVFFSVWFFSIDLIIDYKRLGGGIVLIIEAKVNY